MRFALATLLALASLALAESPSLSVTTSWIGNTYPGDKRWVQQDIQALSVMPDGTLYTNVGWDEGGGQVGEYRDGELIRYARHTHGWGQSGGVAISANAKYIFIAQTISNEHGGLTDPNTWPPKGRKWIGISRRLRADISKAAPFAGGKGGKGDTLEECFLPIAEPGEGEHVEIAGLAANEQRIYVADPASLTIRVLDAETMQTVSSWPVKFTGPIALDGAGNLWILRRAEAGNPGELASFNVEGKALAGRISFAPERRPTAFCFDRGGRLLVADDSPDQQILIYENSAKEPRLTGTFGERGGIFSGVPGAVAPLKFNQITAIGADARGNIYVANDGQTGGGGTVLESYTADGKLNWRLLGLGFVDMADVDAAEETEVFTKEEHFHLDYSRPAGTEASYAGYTVNRFKYPQDPRLHDWSAGAWVRHIAGRRFLFVNDMNNDLLQVYRFAPATDGEVAIPAGLFAKHHIKPKEKTGEVWPPAQPEKGEWVWRDLNGNGSFEAGEFLRKSDSDAPAAQGWWVDEAGNVWLATERDGIRLLPSGGLDRCGNPVWEYDSMRVFPKPPEFERVKRVRYDATNDVLYLGGTTAEHQNQHWKPMGPVMARYDGWLKGKQTRRWVTVAPYATGSKGHESCEPMGFDVAGDYVFVPYTGASKELGVKTGRVEIFRADDGSAVGHFEPSSAVGEIGLQDIRETLRAHRRSDGEYLVFLEDDFKSKTLMYRWKPTIEQMVLTSP